MHHEKFGLTYFLVLQNKNQSLLSLNAEQMHKVITNYKLDHVTKLRITAGTSNRQNKITNLFQTSSQTIAPSITPY